MVFVFMALYPEAKPVIKRLGLRKRTDRARFQEFVSEDSEIVLAITGVGPVAAAAAVAAVLTEYDAGQGDQLLSVGTAAALRGEHGSVGTVALRGEHGAVGTAALRGEHGAAGTAALYGEHGSVETMESLCGEKSSSIILTESGHDFGIFLLNKLLDQNSDRTFYPDMLIKSDLMEASCITGSTVLSQRAAAFMAVAAEGYDLYDMESAAVYQAGNLFLGPHQMSFIRVVSDRGTEAEDRKKVVSDEGIETEDRGQVVSNGGIKTGNQVRVVSDVDTETEVKMVMPKAEVSYVSEMAARVNAVINSHVEEISGYVEKLLALSEKEKSRDGISDKSSEALVDKIIEDGHFSKVMQDQLKQYVKYAVLSGIDWENAVRELYSDGVLPTIDKRGGKKVLDRIKQCIMN